MGEVCIAQGEQCYNCEDYAGAFACLPKIKISGMSVLSELELQTELNNECGDVRFAASVIPCDGDPYSVAISLKDVVNSIGGGSPLVSTFWTPFDLGDVYNNCWYKFNEDLYITRAEFPDFFEAAGIAGDTYTIAGMKGKTAAGSGTGYCNNGEVIGNSNNEVTLDCENLPGCPIQITDPGHQHPFRFPANRDASDGNEVRTIHWGAPQFEADELKSLVTDSAFTGITATHQVGSGGSGNPVPIELNPYRQCGSWYIKLGSECN